MEESVEFVAKKQLAPHFGESKTEIKERCFLPCLKTAVSTPKNLMILTSPIRFYRRFISPLLPRSCRFYPTCSQYALEALERYGMLKGCWLTLKRLSKCHPYHPGGFDPLK